MDTEVEQFLKGIPQNGWILDIGGCWGWHWRKISNQRPDITVVIVDLIRENLVHAQKILIEGISKERVFLVHGNACSLQFDAQTFDGVWSVQTTQHIPDYNTVCSEVYRVLKSKGVYWDYGLNNAAVIRIIYKLFQKNYHIIGKVAGSYFLRRVNKEVLDCVEQAFNNDVDIRYTELLFTPDFKCYLGGTENSILGRLDSYLSGKSILGKLTARQCSIHVKKE